MLASLNLRWSFHSDGGTIALGPVLRELDADVVLLQEVWQPHRGSDTLAPARELGYDVVELALSQLGLSLAPRSFVDRDADAAGSWGLAVLSRRKLASHAAIALGRAIPMDRVGARSALQVTLAGEGSHTVVNVHLSHRPYGSVAQLRRLVGALDAAAPPMAIGGDFNIFGLVSRTALRPLRRTVAAPSWPAHRPRVGLDQIYVRRDVDVLTASVCGDIGSDHLPVRATLRVTPRG